MAGNHSTKQPFNERRVQSTSTEKKSPYPANSMRRSANQFTGFLNSIKILPQPGSAALFYQIFLRLLLIYTL